MEWVSGVAQYKMIGRRFSCAYVGYSDNNLDGTACSDVDECLDDNENMCNATADCITTTGIFE